MVSDWGEAALPDPVPRQRRGWGRGAHPFSLGFCGLIALHLKTLPAPCRASRGDKGAFIVVCPIRALQQNGPSVAF